MDYIKNHYSNYDEDGRLVSQHGQVEYITTMHYIHRYLKSGDSILEVGCGTGRYSLALAKEGYNVCAMDLLDVNLEKLRAKLQSDIPISVMQGNALDLSQFDDSCFDMTLLLGPLYHLYSKQDMLQALNEAIRVTKLHGYIMVAYCMNEASIIQHAFMHPVRTREEAFQSIGPNWKAKTAPEEIFTLMRVEEIGNLILDLPIRRLKFVATDGFTGYYRDEVDAMSTDLFQMWVNYHMSICERQDIIGASNHTLDILQKI